MTNLKKGLIAGGAVVAIAAIVAASVLAKPEAKGEEVYLAKATKRDVASAVTASGKIEARTKVNVQSSVIGEITSLPVKEGDTVKKGDLLVQIDPERYRQEVERMEATVRMQRIAIEQANVALANQRRTLDRHLRLYQNGGFVSQEALERSQLDVASSEISLRSLQEQVSQADAALAKARDELAKTTLRSPIDGTVTQLNAEKGEITLTGTMNNPGTVIMVVSDMSEILATVDVDETRVVQVEIGQPARVVVDAIGDSKPYRGKVSEIRGTGVRRQGQDVGVFEVKIALNEVDSKLRPGMTSKARIETKSATDVMTVPIQAVVLRPRREIEDAKKGKAASASASPKASSPKPSASAAPESPAPSASPGATTKTTRSEDSVEAVFKVIDGKAHLVPVKTGISDETSVVILDGVAEGDTVITGPYRSMKGLKHGDLVREKKVEAKKEEDEGGVEVTVD